MKQSHLEQFSTEWRNLFTDLQQQGYTVEYESGVISITNHKNSMNVMLNSGRWAIVLQKPYGAPDRTSSAYDIVAIRRIEHWLLKAKANPREYNFAAKRVFVPDSKFKGFIGYELSMPV